VLLFTLLYQVGYAQLRTVGVSEGDWFKYNLSLNYDSEMNITSENFPIEDFLVGEQVTLTILNVSGTNVTGHFTVFFENGTEHSQIGSVDLISGEGDLRSWLIAPDLNAGDSLYPSEPGEMINETILQTYLWGSRETNHLAYSFYYTSGEDYSNLSVDMFWDKEIGVVTELSFEANILLNGTSMNAYAEWIIIESSTLEDVPEFTQIAFVLIMVSITFSISLIKSKKHFKATPLII
jgi:hypothetical protein